MSPRYSKAEWRYNIVQTHTPQPLRHVPNCVWHTPLRCNRGSVGTSSPNLPTTSSCVPPRINPGNCWSGPKFELFCQNSQYLANVAGCMENRRVTVSAPDKAMCRKKNGIWLPCYVLYVERCSCGQNSGNLLSDCHALSVCPDWTIVTVAALFSRTRIMWIIFSCFSGEDSVETDTQMVNWSRASVIKVNI